jgi:hypothetical protein
MIFLANPAQKSRVLIGFSAQDANSAAIFGDPAQKIDLKR